MMLPEIMASHGKLPQLPRDPTNHSDVLGHGCFGSVKFPQSFVRMEFRYIELACKGVDMAFNTTQPESMGGMWNVRGLVNNSYYRVKHKVM